MKNTLLAGLQVTKKIKINRKRTIGFMGEKGRVYGTPSMVEDIEYTCHELIQSHLDNGENSVGTHISVDHMGATLEGDIVEVKVAVINIDGRTVSFEAEVTDTLEVVGRGKHNRFIVDINKTFERLNAKHEKLFGK
ncbi:MAG: hotdog domain-containing protein [Rhodospirillales bacterium]